MLKTYEIALDIEKELYNPSSLLFSVSRNDFETVELTFLISQDDTRLNLTGTTVELAIKKPSGLTVYQTCEIVDAITGEVKTMLSNQAYIEYGIYMAEVYVKNGDQLAVSSPFWYMSRYAIMDDETIESINDWSAFQIALFAYDLKPIITNGFPTNTPEYVGQMAFDPINKIAYIANDLTSLSWQEIGTGEGGGGNDTILGIVAPAITPARIGQLYIDTVAKAAYIATGATGADWEQIDIGGLASVTWDDVTEKPIVFPADLAEPTLIALFAAKANVDHDHPSADITDLNTVVDGKITSALAGYTPTIPEEYLTATEGNLAYARLVHDHAATDITDFTIAVNGLVTTALAGYTPTIPSEYLTDAEANLAYSPLVHNHDAAYYKKTETYNTGEIDDIVTGITQGGGVTVTDDLTSNSTTAALSANQGRMLKSLVDGKADINHNHDLVYAPIVHDHVSAEITDLNTIVDGKITSALAGYTPIIPEEYLTATEGDLAYAPLVHNHDAAYAPIVHTHTIANVTGLQTALDNKADDSDLATKADTVHTHTIANVTGLQSALDTKADDSDLATKADTVHTHTISNVTGLQTALDNKSDITHNHDATYAPIVHSHTIANVTGLQAAIDGKADTVHTHTIANVTGLQTALDGKAATSYADAGDNYIIQTVLANLKFWTGTQAAYDAIGSKNATTLYFVTG